VINQSRDLFERFYRIKSPVDDHVAEILACDEESAQSRNWIEPPPELRPLVQGRSVALRARFKTHHVVYSRASTHLGNSHIQFFPNGNATATAVPARIEYIYTDDHDEITRFAVRRYSTADIAGEDMFAQWTDFPARLWSTHTTELETVSIEWLTSQFASWQFEDDLQVVLSLDQVRYSYMPTSVCLKSLSFETP
jgi:hypothetical protein